MGSITTPQTQTSSPSPSDYADSIKQFRSLPLPTSPPEWLTRTASVSALLAQTATHRDINNTSPTAEVQLLKAAGLTRILGPPEFGGGGQTWDVAYRVVREVAKGDGSIGAILGYHLLWSTVANVVGTEEQKVRIQKEIITNDWFIGGAVNPRDADLKITTSDADLVYNGFKHFNTGGVVSDATWLEGAVEGFDDHIFALVPTRQPGIRFGHDWDNIGLRGTESGSVRIDDVHVPWADALGWDAATRTPIPEVLHVPFATLLLPTIQLVFTNFYLGIAQGALALAKTYTTRHTRAWPYGGDNKPAATDEFYILGRYGSFAAHLLAAESLVDRAGLAVRDVYATAAHPADTRGGVTARRRGEVAELVAAAKIVATDTGLRVTAGVFEVTGAKATAKKVGLDRFWRDVRTHSLHDPVAYKERELGRYVLLDEVPEPTWYT